MLLVDRAEKTKSAPLITRRAVPAVAAVYDRRTVSILRPVRDCVDGSATRDGEINERMTVWFH
jgi:hypothetical protein